MNEEKNKKKRIRKKLLGDFQTPPVLARKIMKLLMLKGVKPASIVEPNCGTGVFITSALETFPSTDITGFDINSNYTLALEQKYRASSHRVTIHTRDFFITDWKKIIGRSKTPVLILGNPPWVTTAGVTSLSLSSSDPITANVPTKSNIHGFKGLDAVTGSSNFDISEWMIIELLKALMERKGDLAMICKTSTARKVLHHAFRNDIPLTSSSMYLIDTLKHFNASVSSCLLHCHIDGENGIKECGVFRDIGDETPFQVIGYDNENLIASLLDYREYGHLERKKNDKTHTWRSGIKHDCSKVMELRETGGKLVNGFGNEINLEPDYLYPLLKSSDLANNRLTQIKRWMLVTQTRIGEPTSTIRETAPLTWDYLEDHSSYLDKRASSVYHNRPRYSVFGTGPYAFSPWKVAISGFYKRIYFGLIQPFQGKPVILDDTCYFLPVNSLEEAIILESALNQPIVRKFFNSFIFWDSKRPVTKKILQKLDITTLLSEFDLEWILDVAKRKFPEIKQKDITGSFKRLLSGV